METPQAVTPPGVVERSIQIFSFFERIVLVFLMGLLMLVVALSALELGWLLVKDLSSARDLLLDVEEMFELFGFFLLVLIGLELIASLKSHLLEGVVQVEVVIEIALIAIAQKLIIVDTARTTPMSLLGHAALVLALAAGFWLVRIAQIRRIRRPKSVER